MRPPKGLVPRVLSAVEREVPQVPAPSPPKVLPKAPEDPLRLRASSPVHHTAACAVLGQRVSGVRSKHWAQRKLPAYLQTAILPCISSARYMRGVLLYQTRSRSWEPEGEGSAREHLSLSQQQWGRLRSGVNIPPHGELPSSPRSITLSGFGAVAQLDTCWVCDNPRRAFRA